MKFAFKLLCALGVLSFLVWGFFGIKNEMKARRDQQRTRDINSYLFELQKEQWNNITTTSTTTDRLMSMIMPDDVLIDNQVGINIDYEQLVKDIELRMPSLPIAYWSKYKNVLSKKTSDVQYPSIFELEFNNIYWQTLRSSKETFQLFNAYYDVRMAELQGPLVRILVMIDSIMPEAKTYCQLWFEGQKEPSIVKTLGYTYIWNLWWGKCKEGIYQPYLISCPIPKEFRSLVPVTVSLVEKRCSTASNNLRVLYNRPLENKKKNFAICVKGLDFPYDDRSVRLIEWIELLGILGVDKIFFYELQVHPNISKVLKHYEREGRVHITPLTLPGDQPNLPGLQNLYLSKYSWRKRWNELIPYNDCLYKNMYKYKFIVLLDTDEIIIPKRRDDRTWADLMRRVLQKVWTSNNTLYASYSVRNVFFYDKKEHNHGWANNVPKYMHMLQHVTRAYNFSKSGRRVKCFHNPERILTLHNHFPVACIGGYCDSDEVSTDDGQLHHYRVDPDLEENMTIDTTIWKYKEELIGKTMKTLEKLGFFKRNN